MDDEDIHLKEVTSEDVCGVCSPIIITENDICLEESSNHHEAFLFRYKGGLYRAPYKKYRNDIFKQLAEKPVKYVQNIEFTNIIFEPSVKFLETQHGMSNLYGKAIRIPVYKHKLYDHMVCLSSATPTRTKKFVSVMCRINQELIPRGLMLNDVHAYNISETLDGILFHDIGAISSFDNLWSTAYDWIQGWLPEVSWKELDIKSPDSWRKIEEIYCAKETSPAYTHWNNEYNYYLGPDNLGDSPKGQQAVDIIDNLNFKTATDVGCNKGYFTFYLARKAKSTVGLDIDDGCIDECNRLNETKYHLPVLFGKVDIRDFFYNHAVHIPRFKSDLVLALAIVHHVIKVMPHEDFAKLLSALSNKYILIEDINSAQIYEDKFVKLGFKLIKSYQERTYSLYGR
jgi:SAM-dependent methyltransferase